MWIKFAVNMPQLLLTRAIIVLNLIMIIFSIYFIYYIHVKALSNIIFKYLTIFFDFKCLSFKRIMILIVIWEFSWFLWLFIKWINWYLTKTNTEIYFYAYFKIIS